MSPILTVGDLAELSPKTALELLARRPEALVGVSSPIPGTPGEKKGIIALSTHRLTGELADRLRLKGLEIVSMGQRGTRVTLQPPRHTREVIWWFRDPRLVLSIEAFWRIIPGGMSFYLETRPEGANGNWHDAAVLVRMLGQCGEEIHPLARELVLHNGVVHIHDRELAALREPTERAS